MQLSEEFYLVCREGAGASSGESYSSFNAAVKAAQEKSQRTPAQKKSLYYIMKPVYWVRADLKFHGGDIKIAEGDV